MSDPALLSWLAEPSPGRGIRFWRGERWDLVTYDELAQLVRRAACGLRDLGVDDEARVAVVLPTGPEFVATFLGALLAGAAPVPIAPSDNNITGVRYSMAMREASMQASKQSAGDRVASTGTGDSPLRP